MTSTTAGRALPSTWVRRPVPLALVTAALVALGASLWLDLATTGAERTAAASGLGTATGISGVLLLLAAAYVLHHRPGDTVGRVVAALGLVWVADGVLAAWASYGYAHDLPLTDAAIWFVWRFGAVLLSGMVTLLLLYPTGRLLAGRWRPVAVVVLVSAYLLPVMLLLAPDSVVLAGDLPGASSDQTALPLGDGLATALLRTAQTLTFTSLLASVALLWVRHRRADAAERTQLRWLLWAGIMTVLMVVCGLVLDISGAWTTLLLNLAVATLAASVAIGLVHPNLGDVDALVAWTLTSAAVAAVVVAVDLAVIAAGSSLLGERLDERRVTLVVLVLAVVVYGPLRAWLGNGVRRLMFGRRSDRYDVVSSLAARLEETGSVAEQLPALAGAVASTFKVPFVRVEVVAPDGGLLSATHGSEPAEVQSFDIAYRGTRVGRLVLPVLGVRSMLSRRDQGLLLDLVRQAAIAIRAGLLSAEVQESRERLVLGREDDRRRIRRDLHDGLGPVLGGVALRLDAAGNVVETDPGRARELVRLARTEVADALDDVRRLVHDLRPPALDDLGLEAALRQQAERVRSQVDVAVSAEGVAGLPAAVEVAAYRIVSEALTNVVRHAEASRAEVTLAADGSALTVAVVDDGRGIGPDVVAGVGLLSLRERAEELGGHCEVSCPPTGGTTVHAWLPFGTGATPERSRS
ncbi:sensor histidine kinase [Nocardioides euryhalodurans]|uniref:histidine kinase n=1 Tax=Nocardioides euryhalodurans TaxID=2518370 RepID=A0A4P7GGV9_9ACTN|nr:sensor histidine kinase [Nocardioides euryhalodurans]QBR91056.1 sensor histidine kinase [Nocardioides euryhalodurans]